MYLAKNESDISQGYYIWAVDYEEQLVSLIPFMGVLGYLQIVGTVQFGLLESPRVHYYTSQEGLAAKTAHDDFYKNKSCLDHHGCSYTDYTVHIIDKLLSQTDLADQSFESGPPQVEVKYCDHHIVSLESGRVCNVSSSNNVKTLTQGCNRHPRYYTVRDFNIPNTTAGYLALEATDFNFIGSDRPPVDVNSINTCLQVADVLLSTNKPNYCEARIPFVYGLNISAWETYLQGYLDDRLILYIRFGFPLSIHNRSELHNTNICNHYSALQFPDDISKCLKNEIDLRAMLGPISYVNHTEYHCSPLMSRPKDGVVEE